MDILPLSIFLFFFVSCFKTLSSQVKSPRLVIENGKIVFYAAYGKNIEFKTTPSAGVLINNINLLTTLNSNECASNPCHNGGTCQDMYNSYICRCTDGWQGENCLEDVNECSRFQGTDLGCQNGATCVNKPGTYECLCLPSYVGLHCNRKKVDCNQGSQELCGHGACISQNDNIGYKCICDQGWTTDGTNRACTVDVNECNLNHPACSKSPSVPCINVPGSFYCGVCPTGYTGNGYYCADIDECEINNGGCSLNPKVVCINTQGSRICGSCPAGYEGDGVTCVFKGVCQVNNGGCHYLAQCRDNPRISPTYVDCICPAGYVGSGIGSNGCTHPSTQTDPCASNPCMNGNCTVNHATGEYICSCRRRFTGRNCDIMKDPCDSNPCQNGGSCVNLIGILYRCVCKSGFNGKICQTERPACGGRLYGSSGVLKYPSDDYETYGHSISCSWTIQTNSTKILNITFTKFDLESSVGCRSDWLQIHDGPNSASHLLGRFCGSNLPMGGKILSTQNIIYLWFRSNAGNAKTGFKLIWNSTEPVCGGTINASSHGNIESPGSPGYYPPNRDCQWTLLVPIYKRLLFHFFSLNIGNNTDCDHDVIQFSTTDFDSFAKFCNSTVPVPFYSPVTESVLVHFHSSYESSHPGFQLSYSVVEGIPGCGGTYSELEGTISSIQPEDPHQSYNCEYKIQQAVFTRIKITFLSFDLLATVGCIHDYIEIHEGLNAISPLANRYCGSTLPSSYISNGPITIISSTSTSSKGWKIKYSKYCGTRYSNSSGSFSSPTVLGPKMECIYHIDQPIGYVIEVNIEVPDCRFMDCATGYVEVRDGDNEGAPLLKRLCGRGSEIITSSYNHLLIRFYNIYFRSDFKFKASYTSTDLGCGGILKKKSGILTPASSNSMGLSSIKCSWVMIAPPTFVIKLTWSIFNLETSDHCSGDNIRVFDNNTDLGTGQLIGKYCGSNVPQIILSTSNVMTVIFVKNSTHMSRFQASYDFVTESNNYAGIYYTSSGVIKSPGYPGNYSNNLNCTWKIVLTSGQQILLNVKEFNLEKSPDCYFDWLEIRHGREHYSPLVGKFCGTTIPKLIMSQANELYIHFKTDSVGVGRGFKISWTAAATECGGILTSVSGSITSPQYPEPYNSKTDCTWQISVADGSRIKAEFSELDLTQTPSCSVDSGSDYIQFFDGLLMNAKSLGIFCSISSNPIVSSMHHMLVKFKSNISAQGRRFKLNYVTLCNNTLRGFRGVIVSPNMPNDNSDVLDCWWDIIVSNHNKINITFSYFEINNPLEGANKTCSLNSDYVEIMYMESSDYDTVFHRKGIYCDTNSPGQFTLDTDHALIHFAGVGAGRGFRLEWQLFGCGGILTRNSGMIQTPNYPKSYPSSINCQWQIQVDFGYSIQIVFSDMDIELRACSYDSIRIYNGPSNSSNLIAKMCYQTKPTVISSTGNQMFIDFTADTTYEGRGFIANYSTTPTKCGGKFTAPEGMIYSPNYPKNFEVNDTCYWLIEVDDSHSIEIIFEDVDLPQNCSQNFIKVYDGESEDYSVLETICKSAPNRTIKSTLNKMYIVFSSNAKYTTKGFRAKYNKACGSRIITEGSGNIHVTYQEFTKFSSCRWTIASKDPTRHVTLIITQMQIDVVSHWSTVCALKIYGGETIESPLLKSYCSENIKVVHQPIVSDGSSLTVQVNHKMTFFATYSIFDSHCGGTLNLIKGFFATPGYPEKYASNIQCEWTINVAPGNSISLSFHEFDLLDSDNCNTDFLEIRADNVSGTLLGLYCGKNKPLNITHEKTLWMLYKSNKLEIGTTVEAKGFIAEYELNTQNELRGPKGVIASPLYPETLYSTSSFSWRIIVDPRRKISLTFKEFYIEQEGFIGHCYISILKVYDGIDKTANELGRFCGIRKPDPMRSSTGTLYIVLTISNALKGSKFLLEWQEIAKEKENQSANSTGDGCTSSKVIDISTSGRYSLTSPGYPHGFKHGLNCEWMFSTSSVNHLVVELEDVNLNDNYIYYGNDFDVCPTDSISFYEKGLQDNNWQLVKKICAMKEELKIIELTNLVKIQLSTYAYNIGGTGFNMTVTERCGGSMNEPSGFIYFNASTMYGSRCEWNVTVLSGRTIKLSAYRLPLDVPNPHCDNYIMLRNGKFPDSPLLGQGKYCFRDFTKPLQTTGNNLNVKYIGSPNMQAFKLMYQEISEKCGREIILNSLDNFIVINSPNYPNIPLPHTECSWMITVPPGERLRIDFEERFDLTVSTGCEMEYIEVRDGATEFSPLIGRYCKEAPNTQFSTDNVMFVKFFTQVEEPRNGFKAKLSLAYCGGTIRGTEGVITNPSQLTKDKKRNCIWDIYGPENHYWNIRFEPFKIANGSKIKFDEKYSWFRRTNMEYNGPDAPTSFISISNHVRVSYTGTSDDTFILKFNSNSTECGGYLKMESGEIEGPTLRKGTYSKFCQWKIEVPEGRRVTLNLIFWVARLSYKNLLIIYDGFNIPGIYLAYLNSTGYNDKFESSSNRMQIILYNNYISFSSSFRATFTSETPTICMGDFSSDSGVLTQPDVRNNSYLCRWTHRNKNVFLNQTFAMTVNLNVNETRAQAIHQCVNSTWAVKVTQLEEEDLLVNLCPHTLKNYVVRTPFPVTKVEAYTKIEMNFSISFGTYQCGGIINQQEGILSSPNYPNKPFTSVECVWLIQVDKEQTINLTMVNMDLGDDCSKSFVSIYNGNGPSHPMIGKYCKSNKPDIIISQGESLWIEYRFETGMTGVVFQLKYEAKSQGCGGIYHDQERIIQTPNYGADYPNNAECLWEIRSDIGYSIQLLFTGRFQIESSDKCEKDYVEIFDLKQDRWISIAKKCGRDLPKDIRSTGEKLRILFRTNDRITGNGFKAEWKWICGGTFEATDTSQTIISPGYPIAYKGGLNCVYEIVPKGETFTIHFDDFELEDGSILCSSDNVTIEMKSKEIYSVPTRPFCGKRRPEDMRIANPILITFKTNSNTNKKGFSFIFRKESCGGNVTVPTVIEGPPHDPKTSTNFDNPTIKCFWNITAPSKQVVKLRILNLELQNWGSGQVTIFDGLNEEEENKLATLSGNFTDFEPVHADSGNMLVKLFSPLYSYTAFRALVYFSHGPAEGCGGIVNLTDTKIISPPSLPDLDCSWKIIAPTGYQIQFQLTELNMPICTVNGLNCSFIEIRDGGGPLSELIEKFNSTFNASLPYRKLSTSLNFGYLRLVLLGRYNNVFKISATPLLSKCGSTILSATKQIKILTSPNYPNMYPHDIRCTWLIEAENSKNKINLHFVDFNLTRSINCSGDRVEIAEDSHKKIITEGLGPKAVYNKNFDTVYLEYNSYQAQHIFCDGNSVFDYYSIGTALAITFRSFLFAQQGKGFKLEYSITGCNRNYTSVQGRIYSENDEFNCNITITVEANRTISLYFRNFFINPNPNCTTAGFEVRDTNATGTLMMRDCGYSIPNPVFSHTNKLYIHVYNNAEITENEFMTYDLIYTSTDAGRGCGGYIYNYMGRVSSPLYPDSFKNNTICKWTITVPVGLYIALKFTGIDLHDTCDRNYIKVKESSGNIHTICSNDDPGIIRTGSIIDIEYKSSEQNDGNGWTAKFQGIENVDQVVY